MNIRELFLTRSQTRANEIDWETVYKEQLPRIYNYFRYRLGDETLAEDLTASTFERAWRKRWLYRYDLSSFSTWLHQIARNLAIDHYRSTNQEFPLEAADQIKVDQSPEEVVEHQQTIAHLQALLSQLSQRERELVALKYGAGHTNREIATLTKLSETNVGSILHRVVQKLRSQWEIE